ncbi:hypothetical protein BCR44DRAFT_1439676 [Catenaria anguillulae PL171]|uniref:Uncharacterized protein n=1 Tax=Catenaria anguillulae PL171 TaxID=765915 RepID=A0A1Y2HDN3_9FUNG|nr:hypothetical protein BCR44DRAFT_1439676 [Catenaria anguillulae PL171]
MNERILLSCTWPKAEGGWLTPEQIQHITHHEIGVDGMGQVCMCDAQQSPPFVAHGNHFATPREPNRA